MDETTMEYFAHLKRKLAQIGDLIEDEKDAWVDARIERFHDLKREIEQALDEINELEDQVQRVITAIECQM